MRASTLRLGAALLLLAAGAFAQSIDLVKPGCAAPGDAILIKGSDFGSEPTVLFGDTEADVLRSSDQKIICRVPRSLEEGDITITIGDATADFHVLAEGAPVIVHVSTETATPGMLVFFVGARLKGATASFEDADGETAATVDLKGGWRVSYVKIPVDLAYGTYTVRVSNDAGDTGPCSPKLEIVEAGDPTIEAMDPEEQLPGRPVQCLGTDLGPPGFCFVTWTDGNGDDFFEIGFANGYDRVHTWVPYSAQGGATYDVIIDFIDGSSTEGTGAFAYTVGTPPPPEIVELEYEKGPPGSMVGIFGNNLVGGGFAWPTVEFTKDGVSTEAFAVFWCGCNPDRDLDEIVVEVPRDLEDGDYDVTVTVGGETSNAVTFTVGQLPLTVTSMKPDSQGRDGPNGIVVITGTGFGVPDWDVVIAGPGPKGGPGAKLALFDPGTDPFQDAFKVTVTWTDGDGQSLEGDVIWHTDREILVIPPGGWFDPLPVGEYLVEVTVDRGNDETETAEAGTYTVTNESSGFGGGGGGGGGRVIPLNGAR